MAAEFRRLNAEVDRQCAELEKAKEQRALYVKTNGELAGELDWFLRLYAAMSINDGDDLAVAVAEFERVNPKPEPGGSDVIEQAILLAQQIMAEKLKGDVDVGESVIALAAEVDTLRAELNQAQRDRRAEHDLRVRLAGEIESLKDQLEKHHAVADGGFALENNRRGQ